MHHRIAPHRHFQRIYTLNVLAYKTQKGRKRDIKNGEPFSTQLHSCWGRFVFSSSSSSFAASTCHILHIDFKENSTIKKNGEPRPTLIQLDDSHFLQEEHLQCTYTTFAYDKLIC